MDRQHKITILLTLTLSLTIVDFGSSHPAVAADPRERDKAIEMEFEQALDPLRRDAAKTRPDWMVTATAKTGRWDFTVAYTKGKSLALPVLNKSNSTVARPVPPLTDLVLPLSASVGLYVTSSDDIRPFEVPGLGIKTDALPGRIAESRSIQQSLVFFPRRASHLAGRTTKP